MNGASRSWKPLLGHERAYGGEAMAERIAAAYGVPWPEPIWVDVTNYSGRYGAYTTGDPNHIVLASPGDWFSGLLAVDVLYHPATERSRRSSCRSTGSAETGSIRGLSRGRRRGELLNRRSNAPDW